jgi:hypothetical protein
MSGGEWKPETHTIPPDQLPRHGPDVAKPLPNRKERRAWAREAARQLNRGRRTRVVAIASGNRETCQHGQLVGQCTECAKSTER